MVTCLEDRGEEMQVVIGLEYRGDEMQVVIGSEGREEEYLLRGIFKCSWMQYSSCVQYFIVGAFIKKFEC